MELLVWVQIPVGTPPKTPSFARQNIILKTGIRTWYTLGMEIITLNTWGGRVKESLMDFFAKNKSIDIFCLQEIYHEATKPLVEDKGDRYNLFSEITGVLTGHEGFFRPSIEGYGLAMFVSKNILITEEGSVCVYEVENYTGGANHPRNLQYVCFEKNGEKYMVINMHGLWNGQGKTDTEDRLKQSLNVRNFMDRFDGCKKILCGDFNLRPDTESVTILEKGMRNLIKENEVTSTRTSLYTKSERYADYIFVSPDVEVSDFKVLPDEVSDHSALFLKIKV